MSKEKHEHAILAVEAWLVEQGYAEQTRRNTIFQARLVQAGLVQGAAASAFALPSRRTHLKRIIAAADNIAARPMRTQEVEKLGAFAAEILAVLDLKPKGLRGGRKIKGRKREARSVDDAGWKRLVRAIEKHEGGAARVLQVQASTGLRVGDVLRISGRALHKGVETGTLNLTQKGGRERYLQLDGAPEAWKALSAIVPKSAVNVARVISSSDDTSSSGAAYVRCFRLLHQLETELGLDRLHTHRLRRTVAVQALRISGDLPAVSEMLGQSPGSPATLAYLDEARASDVAGLSKKIAAEFRGKDKT